MGDTKEKHTYKLLSKIIKVHQRDSRRDFLLFLAGLCWLFLGLGVEVWDTGGAKLSVPSIIYFSLSGVFLLLFFLFYVYGRRNNLGDPSDVVPVILKQMHSMLRSIDRRMKTTDDRLARVEKKLGDEK